MELIGVEVADERPLAGRLVGWMFVVGSIGATLLPLLPGVAGAVITPTLPIAIAALLWGLACLRRVEWTTAPGWLAHVGPIVGGCCAAVAVHDSGAAGSPARFLLMLVIVYTGYFFPAREAWPYLGFVLGLHALPLAYDRQALHTGLLGELLIVGPCYWLLAFLLITGKRGMVALRAHADDLARRDPLTGLANRRALLEAAARAGGEVIGLLLLDVDDFKRFNTEYGHPGGDRALIGVADSLRRAVRADDVPARLGGDEFAVLVGDATEGGMAALAERVMATVRTDGTARVSAGWAIGAGDADALLLAADRALAGAKRAGKDRVLAAA
jgi:diguanylate cyclase (GGDEF)-like protein